MWNSLLIKEFIWPKCIIEILVCAPKFHSVTGSSHSAYINDDECVKLTIKYWKSPFSTSLKITLTVYYIFCFRHEY
jgi:hypothetical protein